MSIQHLGNPIEILFKQVNVDIVSNFNRGMSQEFTHNFDVNAFGEEHAGEGVTERMDSIWGYSGAF